MVVIYIREMDAVELLRCATTISALSFLGIGVFIWRFSGAR